jgi:hypothetical protein
MPKFLKRYLRLQATTKGLLGGSRFWTVVWILTATVGVVKRLTGDKPEILYRSELRDNDSLVINASAEAPVRVKR